MFWEPNNFGNYQVPYKFGFSQIIWNQLPPSDRFKGFWKKFIEKHSCQIQQKNVFHNIPYRFVTDSKKFGQNRIEKHF